ncbi:MAG: hypothetical protein ABMA15_04835 [Vicinamibacterales bacterium]
MSTRRRPYGLITLFTIALAAAGCGNTQTSEGVKTNADGSIAAGSGKVPSPEAARQFLRSVIDKGNDSRLKLVSFQKTDGRSMEIQGLQVYELLFTSDAEFMSNAMYQAQNSLGGAGDRIETSDYKKPSADFSWDDFMVSAQGFRPSMKGDRLHVTGRVRFERRESGWVAIDIGFETVHDQTTRDMEAIKAAEAKERAVEEEARRQEQLRVEAEAKRKAEKDANAERVVVDVDGSQRTARSDPFRIFYIGRITSNDVVVIEPVRGRYSKVQVSFDHLNVATKPSPFKPGEAIAFGALGGIGGTYESSGKIRMEMDSPFPSQKTDYFHGDGARDLFIELKEADPDVQVRVTIYCTQSGGNPPCRNR